MVMLNVDGGFSIVPVREIVEVEVKRREPLREDKVALQQVDYWAKILLDNVFEAMAKPRR